MSDLVLDVSAKKKEYRTDYYSMSLGEIANMYKDGELIINPDFQRFFRWSPYQKTRLIESFLLGIPIPSIFIYQQSTGKWEVVDGLQRVSTILEFFGLLKDKDANLLPPFVLTNSDILPGLQGHSAANLPPSLLLDIKRCKFKVEIIQKESDPDAKFEVFMRLNTGGSNLSEQELRNSWLVMYNKDFFKWLEYLSEDKHFLECISLSEWLIKERYNMELVLCFFAYPRFYAEFSRTTKSEALTKALKVIAKEAREQNFDYNKHEIRFRNTFEILYNALGESVFRKYYEQKNFFRGNFLESLFEAVAIGVGLNYEKYMDPDTIPLLNEKIKNIWNQQEFTSNMGTGTNTMQRVPNIVPWGIEYFRNDNKN